MLNNRDRRNGLILTNSAFPQQKKSYGRFNKGSKARYNLSDLVLDMSSSPGNRNSTNTNRSSINSTQAFDISNGSFKLSDDEFENDDNLGSSYNRDSNDQAFGDLNDVPYGMTQVISIAISDNEDSDATMETPEKVRTSTKRNSHLLESTPVKSATHASKKSKPVLQELSPAPLNAAANILTADMNEKRVPMSQSQPPAFNRNNSSSMRNRSSVNSQSSKRWSLLSFNGDDKENLNGVKNKRFSMASGHSTSSKDKSKRFSIASTLSTTSSSSSSFRNAVTKVGNVLTSVSVNSTDGSAESTPYKNMKPGIVGENDVSGTTSMATTNKVPPPNALRSPVAPRQYSQASSVSTNVTVTSSYHNRRAQEYNHTKAANAVQPPTSASSMRIPSAQSMDNSDQMSVVSINSSLKSSRSRFRLSSLFSAAKKDLPAGEDNESVRSLRGKSSFSDMRKSVLTYSQSKTSLFRLTKKDSLQDLKRKPSLDKCMISLPRPDTDSASRLKTKLRNSSSILSINSVVSRQTTLHTVHTANTASSIVGNTSSENTMNTSTANATAATTTSNTTATPNVTAMTSDAFDETQMEKVLELTTVDEVVDFQKYINQLANADNHILVKFAEASYSEVFVLKNFETGENLRIFKVIPFGEVNFEQPTVENIIQELKITKRLSNVDGFIGLNEARVVKGQYPELLMKLWDDFHDLKDSKNYRPEYEEDQKFLILDLQYGGVDLERFQLMTWSQALDVFWSVVKTLDKAEKEMKFEHRDLHWGNIVIDYGKQKEDSASLEDAFKDLSIVEEGEQSSQLVIKLIDYTLSRLEGEDGEVIFTGLDHQDFFKGRGDYQFDIYRFMRNELKSLQAAGEEIDWSLSSFKNNMYWLHYLLDKLVHSKGIKDNEGKKELKNIEYLYKCLDPRKKKLSSGEPAFKKHGAKAKKGKKNHQRAHVYFEDFSSCGDVLKFGKYYGML